MGHLSFLIVADSRPSSDAIRRALEASGHASVSTALLDARALHAEIKTHRPDAIFVSLHAHAGATLEALERLPAPRPLILLSGPQEDSRTLLRAIRLGVKEFLPPDPGEAELRAGIERLLLANPSVAEEARREGALISVVGAKGGIGATTVACQLAAALGAHGATAIVDLDRAGGDVALHFDVTPAYTLAHLTRNSRELDATYLRMLLQPFGTRLHILAAPERPEQGELADSASLERALRLLRREFDWVVLDLGRGCKDANLRPLDLSDLILLVTAFNVPALRRSRQLVELFAGLGYAERLRLVANRHSSRDCVAPKDFQQFLERPPDFKLANDFGIASASIDQGRPLGEIAEKTALARDYRELALRVHEWCGVPAPAAASTGLLDRVAGALRLPQALRLRRNGVA